MSDELVLLLGCAGGMLLIFGAAHLLDRRAKRSLPMFDRILGRKPGPTEQAGEFFDRGWSEHQQGNSDQAIHYYSRAIELDPKHSDAHNNRGSLFYDMGNLDQAIADLTRAIDLNPKQAISHCNRGDAYRDKGDLDQGIADYSKAIELDPTMAAAFCHRGVAYQEGGKPDKAIADYSRAIQLNPRYGFAYFKRGQVYQSQDSLDLALADFSEAINLEPEMFEAFGYRGAVNFKQENYGQAISDFSKLIAHDPENVMAHYYRGSAYSRTGGVESGLADINRVIELDPNWALAHYNRGRIYLEQDRIDQAIDDFTKSVELDPDFAEAYYHRGLALRWKALWSPAIADFEKCLQLAPDEPERTEVQQKIDDVREQADRLGEVDFTPRMPEVDEMKGEALEHARQMAAHGEKLIIFTPGRNITFSATLPPRETLRPEFLAELESLAPSDRQRSIVAIGMTEFRAFQANPYLAVPFLRLLHGLVQIGHAVILFEGHASALAEVCGDADLLVVDSEMIQFLQTDWFPVAQAVMREPNVVKVRRKGTTIFGLEKAN